MTQPVNREIDISCLQASAAVGPAAMLVVAGGSEAGDDLAVHVAPNNPQHSSLAASALAPPRHPERWGILTLLPSEAGLGLIFHHGNLDPLDHTKAGSLGAMFSPASPHAFHIAGRSFEGYPYKLADSLNSPVWGQAVFGRRV